MFTIFRHSLSRNLGTILGWGLSLAVLGGYLVLFYDTLVDQQAQFNALISQYPPEMMAMFGGMEDMFTPHGYINVEFFSYMPLILGIYMVLSGSGLLVGDEESGTLDLVLAHPVSRTAVFWGRLLSFTVSVLAILLIAWAGFVVAAPGTKLNIPPAELALPFLSLFALLALFGALALLLSMLLPARRIAAMIAGLLLVASFFITTLVCLDEKLVDLAKLSPLNYYQGGLALQEIGVGSGGWLAGGRGGLYAAGVVALRAA